MGSLEFLHRSPWVPRVVDLPRMPNPSSKWISTKYPFSNTQEAFLSLEMLDVQLICWNLATSSNLSFFVWFPKISSKQWNINIHGPNKIHSWLRSYRTHSDIVADDLTRHGHCKRLEQYAVASVMIIQFTNMSRQNALSPVYTNKHMKHTESVRVVFMLMDPLDLFLHDKHSKGFSAQKAVFFSFCLRFVWDGARWSRCTENPSYRSQTSGHRQSQFHMFFPLAYWLFYMKQQKPTRLECSIVE